MIVLSVFSGSVAEYEVCSHLTTPYGESLAKTIILAALLTPE